METVYEQFRTYDFNKSPSYNQTLAQVYHQYLIVMSDKDLEVKQDLSKGVINPDRIPAADKEQLQLQTKIFVFCSETDNILEVQDYQFWLSNRENSSNDQKFNEQKNNTNINTNVNGDSITAISSFSNGNTNEIQNDEENDEEGYTSNYQEIVDMIVNNKPIPGIKQIPKTILDPTTASESTLQQRKKPWETNTKEEVEDSNDKETNETTV